MKNFPNVLESVHPELVRKYEEHNLKGTTLESVYQATKLHEETEDGFMWFRFKWVLLLVGVAVLGLVIVVKYLTWMPWWAPQVPMVVVGILAIYSTIRKGRQLKKSAAQNVAHKHILEAFAATVDKLNPTGRGIEMHTGTTVRDILCHIALRIVRAEQDLDTVRLGETRDLHSMLDHINFILLQKKNLDVTLTAAEKFGLVFKKKELFAAVQVET